LKENPLPLDFLNTDLIMTVLKLSKSRDTPEKIVRAQTSLPFRIYKKNFAMGEIEIPINSKDKEV